MKQLQASAHFIFNYNNKNVNCVVQNTLTLNQLNNVIDYQWMQRYRQTYFLRKRELEFPKVVAHTREHMHSASHLVNDAI